MRLDDAVIIRCGQASLASPHVAGRKVQKTIRPFRYIADAGELVRPQLLLEDDIAPRRRVEFELMHVMAVRVSDKPQNGKDQGIVPSRNG
jgi:hypothetical protein